MRDEFKIVTAGWSKDEVSLGLRRLTKAIHEKGLADAGGWGLGGEFGYAADYENETFMLHHYCWCEEDDCSFCQGAPLFVHKKSGSEVTWYKWIGRGMEGELKATWEEIYTDCLRSIGVDPCNQIDIDEDGEGVRNMLRQAAEMAIRSLGDEE